MKFITNSNASFNHYITITQQLQECDEAFIAVAFLKSSGYNLLKPSIKRFLQSGGSITIVTGQNFALTEPQALHALRKLLKPYTNSKIYLANAKTDNPIFHPKLYLFKSKQKCSILSGSANITRGGLISNRETSIIIKINESADIWNEAKNYFKNLLEPSNSAEATLLIIKQYETFYKQQNKWNKMAKPKPVKSESQLGFDYPNLIKHFNAFNNAERQQYFSEKTHDYIDAKAILDKIANNRKLTKAQFIPLLDNLVGSKEFYNLWHSGSLLRLRRLVYPYYKEFQELVQYIRTNKNKDAGFVFENAKKIVDKIEGAGINYVTEIMMTYNNQRFANMNKNPIKVLREEGGVNIKASSSSYSGEDYVEYCELIQEISSHLGLRNMLEADSFFNDVYWKIK